LASTLKAENLVAASIADAADVFGAQAAGHRHRAQFARSGDELPVRLCQFDAKLREQVAVDASLPVLSRPIAAALRCVERLSAEPPLALSGIAPRLLFGSILVSIQFALYTQLKLALGVAPADLTSYFQPLEPLLR